MPPDPGSREKAREAVAALVERYARNRERYRSSTYNEETCRAEFITPLFEALGWDVANRAGYAEQYKDVIHEEGIKVGDYTKAPDYTFRVAGVRKFFVEAKKPFVDLKTDPAPAYQLRRYAWSAKLPLSILTDFEEIAVYDTRVRPKEDDKPAVARILYLGYDELLARFDELWDVFSKEAVLKGSFDRYAEEKKGKRGTAEVDAEFLKEIEGWRQELARTFALRNADLSVDDLNYAVQTTIDRIIFLRIAEGRGAEPYGALLGIVNGADIYKRLVALYRKADARYNSGLFDFKADRLTPQLTIDDKVLRPILQNLYYPQSPYEFSVLPAEILGNVYEQFLGKVITLSKGHRATVEEKPEVKKAGGVYYTPGYIVDYIVKHTVGALCEGKSPKQMEKLRILDPACGSGSFLIRAYQELLDRHLVWYRDHEPTKHRKEVFVGPGGDWRLTTAEKRRIVLNNIFGVDIDRQAVEVTKLSLLLKVLEGENDETLTQQSLFGERALPSLEGNIKCGNSLVADDLVGDSLFDDGLIARARPFSWRKEFPKVFAVGGFDVVLGNPPYSYRNATEESLRPYYDAHYYCTQGNYDLYKFFLEASIQVTRPEGLVGMIVSSSFLVPPTFSRLREVVLRQAIQLLAPLGPGAFAKATVDTCILVMRRSEPARGHKTLVVAPPRPPLLPKTAGYSVTQGRFAKNSGAVIDYRLTDDAAKVVDRLHSEYPSVETGFEFGVGINTGFIRDELVSSQRRDQRFHPMVAGTGISRYGSVKTSGWIMYDPDYVRSRGRLGRSLPPRQFFQEPKILIVRTRNLSLSTRLIATVDEKATYNLNRLSNIIARPGYNLLGLLGVLNSSLYNWLFSTRYWDYEIKPVYLRACPLPDVNDPKLVRAVKARIATQSDIETARSHATREEALRKAALQERLIDETVEKLFGLTERERALLDLHRVGDAPEREVDEDDTSTDAE